jgi:phosphatidylserine/phosphatidylglycerophosphate/cardiolipin synthase-like enzyme
MNNVIRIIYCSILVFSTNAFIAQDFKLEAYPEVSDIHEHGFTLHWRSGINTEWLEWKNRHDEKVEKISLTEKSIFQKFEFINGSPGNVYEFRFGTIQNGDSVMSKPYYFATKSLSSGRIKVFFNHPVNIDAATFAPAKYLNQSIDDTLITYLNKAESTLDIAIYNSTTSNSLANIAGALNAAHARGVRVRIVHDADASNTMINNLNPQIGRIASKTGFNYGLMHNKFVVIDAESNDPGKPMVWTGSTNWTVAQQNGPDENNVIIVQDQTLAKEYKEEFEEMYGSSGAQPNPANAKFGPDKTDNTAHSFIIGGKLVRCYFSPSDGVNAQIINTINSANNDIYFASMIITRNDIASAIINKVNQGVVNTYGITNDSMASPPAPDVWVNMRAGIPSGQMISKNGIDGTMHHKFLFVDHSNPNSDPQVLTGSHNWSSSADSRNDENTLIVHDHDVVNQYYQAFLWMFNSITGGSLSISEASKINQSIVVYPNPVLDYFFFEIKDDDFQLVNFSITDISGKNSSNIQPEINGKKGYFDTSSLAKGVYILNISSQQSIYNARFIKQ